jgi:hypothetical protein
MTALEISTEISAGYLLIAVALHNERTAVNHGEVASSVARPTHDDYVLSTVT